MDPATRYCADIARGQDYDRYLCALFAPEAARSALFAIFAFNAELARTKSLVSEPMLGAIRLQWWRESLDGVFVGKPHPQPLLESLAHWVAEFRLKRAPFEAMVDAYVEELNDEPPADLAALKQFIDASAGSVAALTLAVMQVGGAPVERAALAVARAWGLARLLRALAVAKRQGGMKLPQDRLIAAGITPERALDDANRPGLRLAVAGLVGEGRRWLRRARALRTVLPRMALPALLPATLADGYFARLAKFKYDPFDPRIDLPPLSRQLRLAWKASLRRF